LPTKLDGSADEVTIPRSETSRDPGIAANAEKSNTFDLTPGSDLVF
jgi:hypothetical protein